MKVILTAIILICLTLSSGCESEVKAKTLSSSDIVSVNGDIVLVNGDKSTAEKVAKDLAKEMGVDYKYEQHSFQDSFQVENYTIMYGVESDD